MTGLNHALVGGALALSLPLPIAAPLALISHFALDTLPHFGIERSKRNKSWAWKGVGIVDVLATMTLAAVVIAIRPDIAIIVCATLATAPDYVWVYKGLVNKEFKNDSNLNKYLKWHINIQKFERPWGIFIEILVAISMSYLVFFILW